MQGFAQSHVKVEGSCDRCSTPIPRWVIPGRAPRRNSYCQACRVVIREEKAERGRDAARKYYWDNRDAVIAKRAARKEYIREQRKRKRDAAKAPPPPPAPPKQEDPPLRRLVPNPLPRIQPPKQPAAPDPKPAPPMPFRKAYALSDRTIAVPRNMQQERGSYLTWSERRVFLEQCDALGSRTPAGYAERALSDWHALEDKKAETRLY